MSGHWPRSWHRGGATVIGTVRRRGDLERVSASTVAHAVALDQSDAAGAIRAHAPDGVDRIIEVAFSDNVDLDAAVAKNQSVIAAYATRRDRPDFPFWPMLFDNVTIRLLGSDDFPAGAKRQAAANLTTAAGDGALSIAIGTPLPLERGAEAHDRVDAGVRYRVLLTIPDSSERSAAQTWGGSDSSITQRVKPRLRLAVIGMTGHFKRTWRGRIGLPTHCAQSHGFLGIRVPARRDRRQCRFRH